jgi:hypothetical protein
MWKFCLLASLCLQVVPCCASAQQPTLLNDMELLALRVGPSFDAEELDYFGLYVKNQDKVDSLQYGQFSGSFYLQPFIKGKSERILLNQATQSEFVKYIAFYERFALDPRELNLATLSSLGLRTPLRKYETNGRTVMATSQTGHSYFGEVMRVEGKKILLYDLDIGYDAQLAKTDVRLLDLDTLTDIKIFKRNIAKTTGLITGLIIGIAATAGGFSPYNFSNGNVQTAANLFSIPAGGFIIGLVLDEVISFKRTYHLSRPKEKRWAFTKEQELIRSWRLGEMQEKVRIKMSRRMMFRGQMPPELVRIMSH